MKATFKICQFIVCSVGENFHNAHGDLCVGRKIRGESVVGNAFFWGIDFSNKKWAREKEKTSTVEEIYQFHDLVANDMWSILAVSFNEDRCLVLKKYNARTDTLLRIARCSEGQGTHHFRNTVQMLYEVENVRWRYPGRQMLIPQQSIQSRTNPKPGLTVQHSV